MKLTRLLKWSGVPVLLLVGILWARSAASWRLFEIPLSRVGLAEIRTSSDDDTLERLDLSWTNEGLWLLASLRSKGPRYVGNATVRSWSHASIPVLWTEQFGSEPILEIHGQRLLQPQENEIAVWQVPQLQSMLRIREASVPNQWGMQDPQTPNVATLSPDGKRLAISSHLQGTYVDIRQLAKGFRTQGFTLFDAKSGRQLARIPAVQGSVTALAFSPDNRWLAATCADGYVIVADGRTGKLRRYWRAHPWLASTLIWSLDSKLLVTGSNSRLPYASFHFMNSGTQMTVTPGFGTTTINDASPSIIQRDRLGILTFDGATDYSLRLWDAQTGKLLSQPWTRGGDIYDLDVDSSGKLAVAAGTGVYLFPPLSKTSLLTSPEQVQLPPLQQGAATLTERAVAFSPQGDQLAISQGHKLFVQRLQ